jgi:hypothetical protein
MALQLLPVLMVVAEVLLMPSVDMESMEGVPAELLPVVVWLVSLVESPFMEPVAAEGAAGFRPATQRITGGPGEELVPIVSPLGFLRAVALVVLLLVELDTLVP